ncbi:glycoside hydrolase [Rhizobium sp. LC145]|uniref:glycoside hydrolase n=1 Tax=Rhizobium sp. LC145 TaxID=1120688 RepID=UPI00062A3A8F|nr:glycoside hydrolase [Rhizobium sp. LC145]KKX30687.1 glycoside hydrolase [Rhizobium sp. LC145]TKT59459.1 Rrf2 family transcriptional regulator [Rhizobiaceae bacterium LC148]
MKRLMRAAGILALIAAAPAANATDWLPVREIALTVASGSPLDFSGILPNQPIDEDHRLIAGEDGRIATAASPRSPKPLFCASLGWSPASGGFPDHASADIYARQLAMRGYNIARFHFVDANLMQGRADDFDFNPDVLDRIHYLMAALKRNGIYWMFDGITSWRGAYGGYDDRWDPGGDVKLALHFDDEAFEHWKRLQKELLARINPYTGIAPIKDEALALVILANENGIEFENVVKEGKGWPGYAGMLQKPFNAWLRNKYRSTTELGKAWPDLRPDERLEAASISLPVDRYLDGPRMRDLQAFFVETERRSADRITNVLRDLGYRGLISTYNNWATVQTSLSRERLDAVTMNTYQDWVGGYEPGSAIGNKSSVTDAASYMRYAAASRWLGKPFALSEYDHLFWSRYRYEAGLLMPAYATLQGWDILCRHGHAPIILKYGEPYPHKRAMLPYAIALDPVARAGETLAALLFRRGDVSPARNVIPFTMRGMEDLNDDMQAAEPDALTELALVSRIGLKSSDGLRELLAVNQPRKDTQAQELLDALREAGLLPANNRTDPERGIFESDTGELLLDREEQRLTLSTPRTEAAAFSKLDGPLDLGTLRVESADGAGLIAAAALDGGSSLATAKRILLIFATDARNTNMRFRDPEENVIEDFGSLPVLIRKGEVALEFKERVARWRLSSVGLDGKVKAPLRVETGPIRFNLSNDTPSGPTTFFLLETD